MPLNLLKKRILIAGIHQSGKTYLAKELSRSYKTAVYTPYPEEWKSENVILFNPHDFLNEFPFWCSKAMQLARDNKINLFIVDDADLLFKTHFDVSYEVRQLVISNTHLGKYGLALAFVTRRPQDIPTRIYGICEYMALFTIDSPHAIKLFNDFSEKLGEQVKAIPYGSHQFILKEIGQKPKLMIV